MEAWLLSPTEFLACAKYVSLFLNFTLVQVGYLLTAWLTTTSTRSCIARVVPVICRIYDATSFTDRGLSEAT